MRAFASHHSALMTAPSVFSKTPTKYKENSVSDDLSKLDRLIQDSFTKHTLKKHLNVEEYHILAAKYEQDIDLKAISCIYTANTLNGLLNHNRKRLMNEPKYRTWCVMRWADYPLESFHKDQVWLEYASQSSIKRDREYVAHELNTIAERAQNKLYGVFKEIGLI
jgi:hypothetical protein